MESAGWSLLGSGGESSVGMLLVSLCCGAGLSASAKTFFVGTVCSVCEVVRHRSIVYPLCRPSGRSMGTWTARGHLWVLPCGEAASRAGSGASYCWVAQERGRRFLAFVGGGIRGRISLPVIGGEG